MNPRDRLIPFRPGQRSVAPAAPANDAGNLDGAGAGDWGDPWGDPRGERRRRIRGTADERNTGSPRLAELLRRLVASLKHDRRG